VEQEVVAHADIKSNNAQWYVSILILVLDLYAVARMLLSVPYSTLYRVNIVRLPVSSFPVRPGILASMDVEAALIELNPTKSPSHW